MKKLISLLFVCGQIAVAQTEFSTFMADGETPTLARGPVYYGRSALLSSDDIKGRNFVMYSTDNPALIVVNASSNLGYCHWSAGDRTWFTSIEASGSTGSLSFTNFFSFGPSGRWEIYKPMDLLEQSTPPTPPANMARVFSRDNGSGKTQLCVIFPTGAVQVLATQP